VRKEDYKRAVAAAKAQDKKIAKMIAKLKKMTTARGASAAEETFAKAQIAKLQAKLPTDHWPFVNPRYRPPPMSFSDLLRKHPLPKK
jgi:hypothetical protein